MKKLLLVIGLVLMVGCGITGAPGSLPIHTNENGITYELFYIQGMPCMRIGRGNNGGIWAYDGVTCDWSKWEGNK